MSLSFSLLHVIYLGIRVSSSLMPRKVYKIRESERSMGEKKHIGATSVANVIASSNSVKEVLSTLGISNGTLRYYIKKYDVVKEEYEKLKKRAEEARAKKEEKKEKKDYIPRYYDRNVEKEVVDSLMQEIGRLVKARAKYDITAIADTGLFTLESFQDTATAFNLDVKEFLEKAVQFYIKYKDEIGKLEELQEANKILAGKLSELYDEEMRKKIMLSKLEDLMAIFSIQDKEVPREIIEEYFKVLMSIGR